MPTVAILNSLEKALQLVGDSFGARLDGHLRLVLGDRLTNGLRSRLGQAGNLISGYCLWVDSRR